MNYCERIQYEKEYLSSLKDTPVTLKNLLSSNSKTCMSLNYPLLTCTCSTEDCKSYCYARKGRLSLPSSINFFSKVYNFCENTKSNVVAKIMATQIPYQFSLRLMGCGDLTPQLTKVVNNLCSIRKDVKLFCYTRNLACANELDKRVTVNFSLDKCNYSQIVNLPSRFNLTYTLQDVSELQDIDLSKINVVHSVSKKASNLSLLKSIVPSKKMCPFTFDKLITCQVCRRCM